MWTGILTSIEVILIVIILCYQIKIGMQLLARISKYRTYIPISEFFFTEKIAISTSLLEQGDVAAIFEEINDGRPVLSKSTLMINLINPRSTSGTDFDSIVESLNIYLLKNNGGIADFTIVKDLVERNVAVEDDDLKDSINKPLYLGLMATILGIIFGLFTMLMKMQTPVSGNGSGNQLELDDFLISVCIAMLASLIGLGITTLTGLKFFKEAKRQVEQRKNGFYNFVQTELLPVVSQDFGSSVAKLSRSMQNFNVDFQRNVSSLAHLFQRNYDTLKVQDGVLEKLQQLNVQDFANTNITVLTRLEKATAEFDKFNFFVENLNTRLSETRELSVSLSKLMDRVNNFEGIASKIDARIEESNSVIKFIESQFRDLEEMRSKYTTMLQRVDDNLEDTLQSFAEHLKDKRKYLINLINEQDEVLAKAYAENKTKFDKLDLLEKLDKLDVLSEMNKHIKEEKEQLITSTNRLTNVAEDMARSLNNMQQGSGGMEKNGNQRIHKNLQEVRSSNSENSIQTPPYIPVPPPLPRKGFWGKFKRMFKR